MSSVSNNYTSGLIGTPKSDIEINKFVGDKKVIDTGTLISYNSEDILISINRVQIRFKFVEDSSVTENDNIVIGADPTIPNALNISLYNMHNGLHEGAPNPFHIANVFGKKIFISFFVSTVSKDAGARIFQYTLMESN